MRLIDADALKREKRMADRCEDCERNARDCQYVYGYTLMDICSMLDDAPTIGDWISVKDRLPENDDHVLCCTETKAGRKGIVLGYYMGGMWRCGMNSNVTHWQPLPTMPEEEIECNTD